MGRPPCEGERAGCWGVLVCSGPGIGRRLRARYALMSVTSAGRQELQKRQGAGGGSLRSRSLPPYTRGTRLRRCRAATPTWAIQVPSWG